MAHVLLLIQLTYISLEIHRVPSMTKYLTETFQYFLHDFKGLFAKTVSVASTMSIVDPSSPYLCSIPDCRLGLLFSFVLHIGRNPTQNTILYLSTTSPHRFHTSKMQMLTQIPFAVLLQRSIFHFPTDISSFCFFLPICVLHIDSSHSQVDGPYRSPTLLKYIALVYRLRKPFQFLWSQLVSLP